MSELPFESQKRDILVKKESTGKFGILPTERKTEDIVENNLKLEIKDKKIASQITELVMLRFKPKIVEISGVLSLSTYENNGVEIIKSALKKASAETDIKYLGGGKYKVTATANDYKEAEPKLKKAAEVAVAYVTEHNGTGEFVRK